MWFNVLLISAYLLGCFVVSTNAERWDLHDEFRDGPAQYCLAIFAWPLLVILIFWEWLQNKGLVSR